MDNGRHVHFMVGNMGVCLPSDFSPVKGFGQDKRGNGRDHSSRSVVATKSLVIQPSQTEHGTTKGAATAPETAVTAETTMYHWNSLVLWLHAWRLSLRVIDLTDSLKEWWSELSGASFTSLP